MLIVGESRSIRVLLSIGIGDGLVKRTPHCDVIGKVSGKPPIEVGGPSLQVGSEPAVLKGQVVVFFLVHLFVDDILLCDSQ